MKLEHLQFISPRCEGGGREEVFLHAFLLFIPFLDDARDRGTHHIGNTIFARDVKADISLFMRCIKRKIGEKLNDNFIELKMYHKSQMNIFKKLKKKKRRKHDDEPGNTGFSEAGIYNGLT